MFLLFSTFMRMLEVLYILYIYIYIIDIGTRVYFMEHYYNKLRVNIALIAYRGYSYSTGKPTESGLMIDSEEMLNHIFCRTDID